MRRVYINLSSRAKANLGTLAGNPLTRRTSVFWIAVGLRQALGARVPIVHSPIVPVPERPPWFWIKIGDLWVLTRPYNGEEMKSLRRPEPIGFAVARVLGPDDIEAVVLSSALIRP